MTAQRIAPAIPASPSEALPAASLAPGQGPATAGTRLGRCPPPSVPSSHLSNPHSHSQHKIQGSRQFGRAFLRKGNNCTRLIAVGRLPLGAQGKHYSQTRHHRNHMNDKQIEEMRTQLRADLPSMPQITLKGHDVHQEVYVDGVLAEDISDPSSGVWRKRFDFPLNFGPVGWFYPRFAVTLQYFGKGTPYVTYFTEWQYASYGRYSGSGIWTFDLTLRAGMTGLRKITLGSNYVSCTVESGVYQEKTLPPPEGSGGPFPKDYFQLINSVSLHGYGSANSC